MKTALYFLAHLLFTACAGSKSLNSGYIEKERLLWHKLEKKFVPDNWWPAEKYIYKDSFIIYRRDMTILAENLSEPPGYRLMYYCFADMRNDTYYEFDSLKVDARCLKKYKHADSDQGKAGINFNEALIRDFTPVEYDSAVKSDTVLAGVKHTLFTVSFYGKWQLPGGGFRLDTLITTLRWYYRHDLKAPLLRLNREADKRRKATLVRFDTQPGNRFNGNNLYGTHHLKYYPQKLTPAEDSVFTAWAKYAADNPVKE